MKDQRAFRVNWLKKIFKASITLGLSVPCFQIKKAAIPMSINKLVQTGAKTQLGGLSAGLDKVAYQVGIAAVVKMEPIPPAASETRMAIINLAGLEIFILNYLNYFFLSEKY